MRTILKYVSFFTLGVLVLLLMLATVVEKYYGTAFVVEHIYTSCVVLCLWIVILISACTYLLLSKMYKKCITFLIHISFIIILCGASITHFFGISGYVHLRENAPPTTVYMLEDGNYGRFPFALSLKEFKV